MKRKYKLIIAVIAALIVSSMALSALGATKVKKQMTAEYNGIQIALDGVKIEPKDVAGNVVEPFIVDGTTYLPVRAIANALGLEVDWDQKTQTVILKSKTGKSSESPSLADSLFTEEQRKEIDDIQRNRRKDTFSLALVQDDIETFYWGGTSAFGDVWGQLYRDSGYNADVVWQTLKNDLSIYNAFGSSDYADFWIAGEALYDQYESGELERNLPTDQYKMLIDKLNKITKRLGIFYSSREIADSFSN